MISHVTVVCDGERAKVGGQGERAHSLSVFVCSGVLHARRYGTMFISMDSDVLLYYHPAFNVKLHAHDIIAPCRHCITVHAQRLVAPCRITQVLNVPHLA